MPPNFKLAIACKGFYSKINRKEEDINFFAKVKKDEYKIKKILRQKDIYLFLGTSRKWHIKKAKNPFMIKGIFYPPYA